MVEAETLEEDPAEVEKLIRFDGILIPGGFGGRGTEGKMLAIKFARENNIPFLGICLGMQLAVIEFARNVANLENANSTEFDEDTPYPVIDILPEQTGVADMGGTMRLGDYEAHSQRRFYCHKALRNQLHCRAPPPSIRSKSGVCGQAGIPWNRLFRQKQKQNGNCRNS